MNSSSITAVPETAMEVFSGYGGTKSDFVSTNPGAIYVLLAIQLIGTLLNVYLVRTQIKYFYFSERILQL